MVRIINFRSMFSNIFGKKPKNQLSNLSNYVLLNNYDSSYVQADYYNDVTITTCITTIANNFAKVKMNHAIKTGKYTEIVNDNLNYLLDNRPNVISSSYDFLYKTCYQLLRYNNAFVYIQRDNKGNVMALWPLDFQQLQLKDYKGQIYCQFLFMGNKTTVPYAEIIHLRKNYGNNEIYGDDNSITLRGTMDNLAVAKQSINKAIKASGNIRGYLKVNGMLQDDDLDRTKANFVNSLNKDGSGIGVLDTKADYHQITSEIKTADNSQLEFLQAEIYRYFGLNKKIIEGDYTEQDYTAFFESVIKPLVLIYQQEFSAKLFTLNEIRQGNMVSVATDRLEYSNIDSKTKMAAVLMQSGVATLNELRQLFGFAPVPDGDSRYISLNYMKANSKGGDNKDE